MNVCELTPQNGFAFPLLGAKREGASTSPSLQLDLGQLDDAVKEILAYEGAMWSNGDLKPH